MKARFLWERLKRRKLSFSLILLGIALYIFIPTGTPDDLITTLPLIRMFGWKIYLTITLILLGFFLGNGKMRSLFKKPTLKEAISICRKIERNRKDIQKCIIKSYN